jgi:hypothetical protein
MFSEYARYAEKLQVGISRLLSQVECRGKTDWKFPERAGFPRPKAPVMAAVIRAMISGTQWTLNDQAGV